MSGSFSISNWISTYISDDEQSRYHLWNYLKHVHLNLERFRLYPTYDDVVERMNEIHELESGMKDFEKTLPPWLNNQPDINGFKGAESEQNTDLKQVFRERLDLATPQIEKAFQLSVKRFEEINAGLIIEPLGLITGYLREGILLAHISGETTVYTWNFRLGIQETKSENSRMKLRFTGKYEWTLSNSIYQIKNQCIHASGLANSSITSWYCESKTRVPVFSAMKQLAAIQLLEKIDTAERDVMDF